MKNTQEATMIDMVSVYKEFSDTLKKLDYIVVDVPDLRLDNNSEYSKILEHMYARIKMLGQYKGLVRIPTRLNLRFLLKEDKKIILGLTMFKAGEAKYALDAACISCELPRSKYKMIYIVPKNPREDWLFEFEAILISNDYCKLGYI